MPDALRFALRALARHPATTAINVVGLAVALAAALLIALHLQSDLAFDQFHEKADRIVQAVAVVGPDGDRQRLASTPVPFAEAVEAAFPEVVRAVQVAEFDGVVRRGDDASTETVTFVGRGFFDTFSFGFAEGDARSALDRPDGVVLAEPFARRLFGDEPAVGQPLSVRVDDQELTLTVTGVAPAAPAESSVQYRVLLPFEALAQFRRSFANPSWGTLQPTVFLELDAPGSAPALAAKLPGFLDANLPDAQAGLGIDLIPLADVHLAADVADPLEPTNSPLALGVLGTVGLLVLLMACVNFTTIALSRAAGRAREVGVRKATGALRSQLVRRFWGETAVLVAVALALAVGLAAVALPSFNALVARDLALGAVGWRTPLTLVGLLAVVTLVAGAYPALYLSGFEPVRVLRGDVAAGGRRGVTRTLVTLQFAASTALVVVLLVMARQLHHVDAVDLGYESDRVVRLETNVWNAEDGRALTRRLRAALADDPAVVAVAGLSEAVGSEDAFPNLMPVEGPGAAGADIETRVLGADAGAVEALGLTLTDGRALSEADGPSAVLVNRAFADAMGWDDPVGRRVSVMMTASDATVVGVVDDFRYRSVRADVEPLVVHGDLPWVRSVYVRLTPGPPSQGLAAIEEAWRAAAPGLPFEPTFLSDAVAEQYAADRRWTRVVGWASAFAVGIGLLGLLGLASLAADERRKEVGVRKVLGASVPGLVALLSWDLVRLVALAFVVATPVAAFVLGRWLDGFASRVALGPLPFVAAGLIVLLLAVLAVGTQTARAALADPVRSLRSE